jgi:hypothetical protein
MEKHDIPLTSAEMSCLWSTYVADSMSICILKYFLKIIEDKEIKQVVEHALDLSQQHVEMIRDIFTAETIPVPQGFTDADVNLNAKRLFSDSFCLHYVKKMAKAGLMINSSVLPNIYRNDILSFYSKMLTSTIELNTETIQLLLEKGLASRPPQIPKPKQVEFIHKQAFLFDFLGKNRPLTGIEITNLCNNLETSVLVAALGTAFAQTASSEQVREYMLRGRDIAKKHIDVFSSYLKNADLPAPTSHGHEIEDTTEAPFSDKLMMFHFSFISDIGIGNYGMSISQSQRSDLVLDYSRLLIEILKFAGGGANIMISEGWLEQPPMAVDRKKLAEEK